MRTIEEVRNMNKFFGGNEERLVEELRNMNSKEEFRNTQRMFGVAVTIREMLLEIIERLDILVKKEDEEYIQNSE